MHVNKLSVKVFPALFALMIVVFAGSVLSPISSQPGTQDDPIITRSYGEKFYGWRVEQLIAGNYILMKAGCEAVLRSGKAVVSVNDIVSLTRGGSFSPGQSVPANHLLLSPKGDGRGIKIQSASYVLVRGDCFVE